MARTKLKPGPSASLWVIAAAAAISGLLVYTGATTGEWHGVIVTEVQVVVVAIATYIGLR